MVLAPGSVISKLWNVLPDTSVSWLSKGLGSHQQSMVGDASPQVSTNRLSAMFK